MSILQLIFTAVLNMSITASYVAIGVILIRLLLKKLPKIFSYALWLAVFIRLVCPVSFTSGFSFLNLVKPGTQQNSGALVNVPYNIGLMQNPSIDVGIDGINKVVNDALPQAVQTASVNPMQVAMSILSIVWVIGVALLTLYSIISYLKVMNHLKTATLVRGEIFETDRITTPLVIGFIKPKIYIPIGISQNELSYILAHEMVHIRRLDYLVKPFAFLVLLLHWFNPLMWLCFFLMSKDMEMSCDESVLKSLGDEIKANYSHSLLTFATGKRHLLSGSPLAFGESNTKARIKNVLSYKKPAVWVMAAALVATAALVVVFASNPKNEQVAKTTVHSGYATETLIANRTSNVGDNSKVVALIDAMPLPAGIVRDTVKLQTSATPYGITINYTDRDVQGAINGDTFYRNSILLFSLIDNVDVINSQINNGIGKDNSASYSFTYTREMAEKAMGDDVRHYASSTDTLIALIDRLNNKSLDMHVSAQAQTDALIQMYLETIMSSHQTWSNPQVFIDGKMYNLDLNANAQEYTNVYVYNLALNAKAQDYINAHKNEYNAILAMDAKALPYLFSQFEKGGQTGVKGKIMEKLCRSIQGGEDIKYANKDPQDWYDTYKKHIQGLAKRNSLEFMQQHYPKGSLILSLEATKPYEQSN